MDIREVRRRNLKLLMDREFGAGARGAQSRLAEKLGKPQNFVSRCLADPSRSGAKTIGEDFAREIEEAFKLARYALDSEDEALLLAKKDTEALPAFRPEAAAAQNGEETRRGSDKIRPATRHVLLNKLRKPELLPSVKHSMALGLMLAVAEASREDALEESDFRVLYDTLRSLKKNKGAQGNQELATLPESLQGLAEATFDAIENGAPSDDMLGMLQNGIRKQQPDAEATPDVHRKKRTS